MMLIILWSTGWIISSLYFIFKNWKIKNTEHPIGVFIAMIIYWPFALYQAKQKKLL
jgi:ABC-type sulfate transport system permease component